MIDECIFFDIETLPTVDSDKIAELDAGLTHPANMSKTETIATWVAERRPAALQELIAKTVLDGSYGRVASIAFAAGDTDVTVFDSRPMDVIWEEEAEQLVLNLFFSMAEGRAKALGRPPILVGHNIVDFDVRFLWKRALVLGLRIPDWWPVHAKAWDRDRVFDTMTVWEGTGGRISQRRLARILGVPSRGGIDGSQVAAAWAEGRYDEVVEHNMDDVEVVRGIWKRLNGYTLSGPEAPAASPTVAFLEEIANGRPAFRPGFRPGSGGLAA